MGIARCGGEMMDARLSIPDDGRSLLNLTDSGAQPPAIY